MSPLLQSPNALRMAAEGRALTREEILWLFDLVDQQRRALLQAELAIDEHAPYVEKLVDEALTASGLPDEASREQQRNLYRVYAYHKAVTGL